MSKTKVPTALVTTMDRHTTNALLDKLGLRHYFTCTVTGGWKGGWVRAWPLRAWPLRAAPWRAWPWSARQWTMVYWQQRILPPAAGRCQPSSLSVHLLPSR